MPQLENNTVADSDIMIVDDNPANLKLLEEMLLQRGHEVRSFPLGRLALAAAARHPPDLILLDINMPEMDGYEVCAHLKASGDLAGIPVIFLSALSETHDKIKAFRSGAVDYIAKPFQLDEVHARVETHLELHHLQLALRQQNCHLEETVAARTHELAAANERLILLDRSKIDFLHLISHEFRTPLNGILGVGDLILEELPHNKRNYALQGLFKRSRRRVLSILDDALLLKEIDVSREQYSSTPIPLCEVLSQAVKKAAEFAAFHHVTLAEPLPQIDFVAGHAALLARAFEALLETAVEFSQRGETVRIACETAPGSPTVVIESVGRTIPDGALPKFFALLSISEAMTSGGDFGLRVALAHRILSLFGASLTVANQCPPGIRLTVSLKSPSPAAESEERSSRARIGAAMPFPHSVGTFAGSDA